MSRARKLVAFGELPPAKRQITRPCVDCPMARTALNGWLGGSSPEEYVQLAHSDLRVACHAHGNCQCAGMAIYRANVAKSAVFRLPKDEAAVFATPFEFLAHHNARPGTCFKIGEVVLVEGREGTVTGFNTKIPGDVWVEFPGTGTWSYHPSNILTKPPSKKVKHA